MYITINGIEWHISFVTPNSNELQRNNGTYTIGMTDKLKQHIYLADNLDGSTLYDVVCHELVHAFCLSYDIYLTVETEEMLAEFVATYSHDILQLTDDVIGEMIRKKIA